MDFDMTNDQADSDLIFTVWSLTGWDMTGFTDWISSPVHWKDHPQKLAHLVTLRERLSHAHRTPQVSSEILCLHVDLLFAEAQRVAGVIRGEPLELAAIKQSKGNALRRQGFSKLSESQQKSIVREWNVPLSTYGLRQRLAHKYEVSEDLITRVIKKSASNKPA
jgi:hypothetical protein